MLALTLALSIATIAPVQAQSAPADRLIDAAMKDSAAWNRLAELVDTFGNRPAARRVSSSAIDWIAGAR